MYRKNVGTNAHPSYGEHLEGNWRNLYILYIAFEAILVYVYKMYCSVPPARSLEQKSTIYLIPLTNSLLKNVSI